MEFDCPLQVGALLREQGIESPFLLRVVRTGNGRINHSANIPSNVIVSVSK